MTLIITRPAGDLRQHVWTFYVATNFNEPLAIDVTLSEFQVMTRKTKRHKWAIDGYHGEYHRSRPGREFRPMATLPIIPADVMAEIIARCQPTITVKPVLAGVSR